MTDNCRLKTHQKLNNLITLQEDFEYWQDKLLEIKIKKVKEDFEIEERRKTVSQEFEKLETINQNLKENLNLLQASLINLKADESQKLEELQQRKEKINSYERQNENLYSECMNKYNYINEMTHKPDVLLNHILKFDERSLRSLCIRLNKLAEEKGHILMKIQQQQYYNQMMINGGPGFYPINNSNTMNTANNVNMPFPPGFYHPQVSQDKAEPENGDLREIKN